MKKLLAILLTLAMLVPMCGFAEESAPGATRTVIFLKDFNAKVLGADIDEAEEKAVNDFLDALRVIVYQQGTTSAAYEVTLNDQPMSIMPCSSAARMSMSAVTCWARRCI